MNVLPSVEILFLVALIMASLQISPSIFMLFFHHTLGKNSKKTTLDYSLFFIAGIMTMLSAIFLTIYYIVFAIFLRQPYFNYNFLSWILAGLFFAYAIFIFFYYFRKGKNTCTSTFLPRKCARSFVAQTKNIKTRSDAFILGALSIVPEFFLTLPLGLVTSFEIMKINSFPLCRAFYLALIIFITVLPLLFIRFLFRSGLNLANIERIRCKNKNFLRLFPAICYIILGVLIIYSGI